MLRIALTPMTSIARSASCSKPVSRERCRTSSAAAAMPTT
jgi:hypothetical protein